MRETLCPPDVTLQAPADAKNWKQPMTEIYQVDLTKRQLEAMRGAERRLLLLLGHAINEINVFQKLVLMSGQGTHSRTFVDHVQAGQTLILMRTLIGKLCEAWDLFRVRFLSERQLSTLYLPRLHADALAALESLKQHFGTQSPLTLIRNRFSFHYKDENDLVERSFQEIPDDESWHLYLSNMEGNCFFDASELVVQSGVTKLANQTPDDAEPFLAATARSFGALCDLTIAASHQIQTLVGECITEIVGHSLPDPQVIATTDLAGLPALSDMRISFFVDDGDFKPKA
jgi:hypothetical protein